MDDCLSPPPGASVPLPDELPPSDAHALLGHPVRRRLLALLARLETSERLTALTRSLAAAEDESVPDDTDRLRIQLYHVHVPKLVDHGLATVDDAGRRVELTSTGQSLAQPLVD